MIPRMRRQHFMLKTCGLRGCYKHAEWISTDPQKPLAICHDHMLLIDRATVDMEKREEAARNAESNFSIADLGELDERGNVIAGPGDQPLVPKKGNPPAGS